MDSIRLQLVQQPGFLESLFQLLPNSTGTPCPAPITLYNVLPVCAVGWVAGRFCWCYCSCKDPQHKNKGD